ncbi:MAG: hypothetical protein QME90_08500, partial [Thermodesulfobacteriota bacterium]|nr:hypothetical protein [Thermodesulfobacteriota bacterium]
ATLRSAGRGRTPCLRRNGYAQAGSSELKTINQIPNKLQCSNNQTLFDHWNLEFGDYLVIGAWSLVIGGI